LLYTAIFTRPSDDKPRDAITTGKRIARSKAAHQRQTDNTHVTTDGRTDGRVAKEATDCSGDVSLYTPSIGTIMEQQLWVNF